MDKISEVVKADYISNLGKSQVEVDCVLSANEDAPIISLVGTSADAVVLTAENVDGEGYVTGRVNFKAVYVTEDNKICAMDYFSDFKSKVELSTKNNAKLFAFGRVINVEKIELSQVSLTLRAIVEIEIVGVVKREFECVSGENLCKKTVTVRECELKDVAEGVFDIYEEFESGGGVEDIILLDTDLIIKEGKPTRDGLLVTGTAVANITIRSKEGIKSKTLNLPFCEEVSADGVTPEDDVYLFGFVKDARIVLSGDETDTTVRVEITVALRSPVFAVQEREVLVDGYSCSEKVAVQCSTGKERRKIGEWNYEERLSGSAIFEDDTPPVRRILTTTLVRDELSAVLGSRDQINVQGTVSATVIYEDTDGLIRSHVIELPYSITFGAEGASEKGEIYLRSAVCDVTAVAKRAKEIEVMYVLKIHAYECEESEFKYVCEIKEIEEEVEENKPIVMYLKKEGEDLWEIAKALRVLESEIENGENNRFVLCYRQLN